MLQIKRLYTVNWSDNIIEREGAGRSEGERGRREGEGVRERGRERGDGEREGERAGERDG